jgi:sugar phosphate permease
VISGDLCRVIANERYKVTTGRGAIPKARWVRILPGTVLIYVIAYMERMNISLAMAGGINRDLHLSMTRSGLAAGVFFLGYMLLQVPAGHIAEHLSAKKYVSWSIVAMGTVSVLTGFVQNGAQLIGMRFLLGVAEGGIYPALLIVVSKWFPSKEIGRANAVFLASLPLSTVLTNPISGWLVSRYDWRWMFFLEGGLSLLLVVLWLPMISDRPGQAKWISLAEKNYLEETLEAERLASERHFSTQASADWSYKRLLLDRNIWLMTLIVICYTTGQYGYSVWLPTLLSGLTRMSLGKVGWLSSLPFVAALGGLYVFGALSDKRRNRRLWTAVSLAGFAVSLLLATLFTRWAWVAFALLVVTGFFLKAMQSPFWAMPPLLFPPGFSGGARGFINAVGNLGGFVGPLLVGWSVTLTGKMQYGSYCLVLALLTGAGITLLLPPLTTGQQE